MNNRGFVVPVIVILISVMAIGLVGAAWYYEANKEGETTNTNTQITNTITAVTNTNTAVNTNTASLDTSDWQKYTNEELGYSIQYPSDWNLDTEYISKGSLYILSVERQQELDAGKIIRVMDVLVRVYKSSPELPNNSKKLLSFENWIEQEAGSYGFINRKPITLDGIQGYQGIGSGDGTSYLIFIQNGDYIYQLETGDTTIPTQIEQNIINNFQFLPDTSDWQTHTNDNFGFSIDYPVEYSVIEYDDQSINPFIYEYVTFKTPLSTDGQIPLGGISTLSVRIFTSTNDTEFGSKQYNWAMNGFPDASAMGYNEKSSKQINGMVFTTFVVASGIDNVNSYFIQKDNIIIEIYDSVLIGDHDINEAIIETFQFID